MKKDEIGNKYGALTVIGEGEGYFEGNKKRRSLLCKCECGKVEDYSARSLRRGNVKFCRTHNKYEDFVGTTIGTFTCISELDKIEYDYSSVRQLEVQCSCGNKRNVTPSVFKSKINCLKCGVPKKVLKSKIFYIKDFQEKISEFSTLKINKILGKGKSGFKLETVCECGEIHITSSKSIIKTKPYGCFRCNIKKANESRTFKYQLPHYTKIMIAFGGIKNRCYNEKDPDYKMYGGRGVNVEQRWLEDSFKFYEYAMEIGYKPGLEFDRIDNDKGYIIGNLQMLTPNENKLKSKSINLTREDVLFIRSDKFDWEIHRGKYTCSDKTLKRIIEYKTFREID